MDRSVWTINNKHFTLILDAKTESGKVSDRKFSPGEDIWTNEIPQLKFEDENTQKEYDNFISDLLMLLSEPNVDQVFIDAKIGEESEYDTSATYEPVIIRKIEDYELILKHGISFFQYFINSIKFQSISRFGFGFGCY